jgi:argininosuccinate lyase
MEKFNESIGFDKRCVLMLDVLLSGTVSTPLLTNLTYAINNNDYYYSMWAQDIRGSIAYAKATTLVGILTPEESSTIISGLEKVHAEWASDTFVIQPGDEDIHTANERRLTEIIGPEVGGKLHTGRSRNDQVATDTRLWIVDAERDILKDIGTLLEGACEFATTHIDVLMAGYTHLQPAQPIRFSHWLMSHMAAITRDAERLRELIPRANMCPLGSGALAGNAFGVDREFLAKELGFDGVTSNSIDSVCDRDFVVEFLMWHSLLLTHLSQLAEDLIINNMLKCVEMDDAYATGSSLMPQKKNPDALELLRGKAGVALGRSVGLMATLKGLPRAYNKDLQEDKVPLFDAVDTVKDCLAIATGVIVTMKPNPKMLMKALCPEMLATDLADYLVRKGVPFRETHHISGACVRLAEESGVSIDTLTLEQLQNIDARFEADVLNVWNYEVSVERKSSIGGTAKARVVEQIEKCSAFAKTL